ncbi:MAG: methyltransferase domain-containing protein [Thermomicrobiales bacterium]|nr:methyltransferase domain-containing protein [Thermomicrobiales bacterium]
MTVSTEEWNATVYHKAANPHVSWGAGVVAAAELAGNERVADVGCGTGRVTEQLLELLPDGFVIGIDRSANMVEEARRQIAPRYPGRVAFLQRDLLELLPDDIGHPVDVVFSTATFHWIRDHTTLFQRLFAILNPGGRLIAQCGGGPNLQRHVDRAEALMASAAYRDWFSGWDAPRFYAIEEVTANATRDAGFIDVETAVIEAPAVLGSADEFATFLTNIVFREHVLQIPDEAMRTAFIDELTRQSAQDETPFLLDYWRLNMRGLRPR